MDRAFLSFSHGKRMCLGLHLAWCEMLKVLPELIRKFDIEFTREGQVVEMETRMTAFIKGLDVRIRAREEES